MKQEPTLPSCLVFHNFDFPLLVLVSLFSGLLTLRLPPDAQLSAPTGNCAPSFPAPPLLSAVCL